MENKFSFSRLIIEEFDVLNSRQFLDQKLSYAQPTCSGFRGSHDFSAQQVYDVGSLLKQDEGKRIRIARNILDSTRIQTNNFLEREQIKRRLQEERDKKLRSLSNYRKLRT